MAEYSHPILIGCSAWTYDDWVGPFYPAGMKPAEFLPYYADRLPIVEADNTFYRSPTPAMVRGWRDRTPPGFKFALKVPRSITHQKELRNCQAEVAEFVTAISPLGDKLMTALLQLGYFNQGSFATLDDFLAILDPFLAAWPHDQVPLALETRNPRWVGPELVEVLRRHNTALTLTEQSWMPRPKQIADALDVVTGPLGFVRLLGDRAGIEKITTTWDKIVVDRSADMTETAEVIKTMARRVPVVVFATNHYAGYSPGTAGQLGQILGLPEPVIPERPKMTLFD
jgi:uncharacterized protein YecE (DUF72 family)